jgi:hypothetical protein
MNSLSTTTGWRGWLGQSLSRSKVTARSRRQTRRRSGALIEQLEDRTLLSSLDITSGVLTYDGSNPTPAASRLTVSETAGVYTFTDLDQTITLGSGAVGWTGDGTNTVTGPANSLTSIAIIGGIAGGNGLTIDFSGGDPLPSSGLSYNPTATTGGASNALTLRGGSFTSEVYNATGTGAGSIVYNTNKTITFSNLSPVNDTVVSPTFVFNSPAGNQTVNVNTGPVIGAFQTNQINDGSTGNFELVNFANKTSATVNTQAGNDTITVNDPVLGTGLTTLNVNAAGGNDTLRVQSVPAGLTVNADTGSGTTDVINIGSSGSLAAIQGSVFVKSTGGSATLNIDDSADPTGRTFNVSSAQVGGGALANPIDYSGGGITTLGIKGGTGNDIFNLNGLGSGTVTAYSIDGGAGTDTLNVQSTLANLNASTTGVLTFNPGNVAVNYANIETVNVTKPAVAPVGTARTVHATEALAFTNVTVASFTAADLGATAGNFVASINWGDGSPTSGGSIVANGTAGYDILGNHTYARQGTYTVNVTLTDQGTSGSTVVGGTTINVVSQGPVVSSPSPIASTADVAAAPLTAQGVPVSGLDGVPLAPSATGTSDVLVATFTDTGTIGSASGYTASIKWGDGSTSPATRITSAGTANGTVFSVFGNHTYASNGSFPVVTTVTKTASGAQAIAASTATIADAPLSPAPIRPIISATEGVYFSGPLGDFTDLNPSPSIAEFKAIIDWGDGSPMTAGTILPPTIVNGTPIFQVSGSHTYADSIPAGKPGTGIPGPQNGTYPITIYVTDLGGAAVNLTNTASVADVALTLAGQLDPASDSGNSNSDAITNVTQPRFFGTTSEPDANVFLYATPSGSVTRTLLGQASSDGNGAWSITSGTALADGSYTISAQATDSSGHTLSDVTTITQNLVIDTVGPKVTGINFDRIHGQVQITFQDFGGVAGGGVGLNQLDVMDANNYRFRLLYSPFNPKHVPKFLVTSITVNPGTNAGAQVATVVINNGRYMRGGHFLFTARSVSPENLTGIQDLAGNALDGEFYRFFPSGNNHVGGDFVAEIDSLHHRVYAPRTVIGPATPVVPPGTPGTASYIPTFIPGKTPHAQAATRLSSRGTLASAVHTAPSKVARLSTVQAHSLSSRRHG